MAEDRKQTTDTVGSDHLPANSHRAARDQTPDTSNKTTHGRNSEKIERRTSNAQHRTSNIDDATLYLFLKQAKRSLRRAFGRELRSNDSGSNDSLRQAQGLSLSKAAESNFEGLIHFAQSFF
jgi:hypothetical protein